MNGTDLTVTARWRARGSGCGACKPGPTFPLAALAAINTRVGVEEECPACGSRWLVRIGRLPAPAPARLAA